MEKRKMKTLVVEKDGSLQILECSLPTYNDCQALVKIVSCGVCNGTDAKLIHHKFKGFGEDMYPLMLGHEAVGRVIELGKKVTSFKIGDLVLLPFAGPIDGLQSGWGAFSEYGVVCDPNWDTDAYGEVPECAFAQTVLPKDIDAVEAAMIITLREVLASIKRFGIAKGESIAVFGCGPVGLTFIKFMHLLGVGPIIAMDIDERKFPVAQDCGADYVFDSRDAELVDKIRNICPNGVKYVLDAVGISALINTAMPMLCDQGKICCYGISANTSMNIDWTLAPYNWQLQFQQFPSKKEEGEAHAQVIKWLNTGAIKLSDYISDIADFSEILEVFERLENRQISKKCIIRYE